MSGGKKEDVHLKLSEELEGIDAELEDAMEALSATNERIDAFLNDDGEPPPTDDAPTPAEEAVPVANADAAEASTEAAQDTTTDDAKEA